MAHIKSLVLKIITIYLVAAARLTLKKHKPYIIGITGSIGKTTTKDFIAQTCGAECRYSRASYNGELGVALSILGLKSPEGNYGAWLWRIVDAFTEATFNRHFPPILILEVGAGTPGEIPRITKWLKPDLAILTALPSIPSHIEKYKNKEEVINDKLALMLAAKKVIGNGEDKIVQEVLRQNGLNPIVYSALGGGQIVIKGYSMAYDQESGFPTGTLVDYTQNGQAKTSLINRGLGEAYRLAFAVAALATEVINSDLGLNLNIKTEYQATPGRIYLWAGIKQTLLIDDAYNAAPNSMLNGLMLLKEVKAPNRKIAVLGDMLELGEFTVSVHETIGDMVGECATDLVLVGPRAKFIGERAIMNGFPENKVKFFNFTEVEKVADYLKEFIEPKDIIFLKGSHGANLWQVVELLKDQSR